MKRLLWTVAMSVLAVTMVVTHPDQTAALDDPESHVCRGWYCSHDIQCQFDDPEVGRCHLYCLPLGAEGPWRCDGREAME